MEPDMDHLSEMLKKARKHKNGYTNILGRWNNDNEYRKSLSDIGWSFNTMKSHWKTISTLQQTRKKSEREIMETFIECRRCTQITHPQRAWRTHSLLTSTHECEWVLVAVKMVELYHLCAPKRFHLQVNHVTPMLVVPTPSHFPSITARSTPRDLLQDNTVHRHLRKNLFNVFQNNFLMSPYQQTQSRRKTRLKNPSQILNMRVRETCASTPTGYEPKDFTTEEVATIPMMSPEKDIYQLYDVQDQQAPVMEGTWGFGHIQLQSLLDQEMAKMSPIKKMSYLQSRTHVDESVESNADSDLERDTKVADFITVCPRSFWETRCNGHSRKWSKCTNVSFIRSSGSYLPGDRLHCFHQNVMYEKPKVEFCVRKR